MPMQSFAETNQSEVEFASSKPMTVEVYFNPNDPIPVTYYYNLGGWSGVLNKVKEEPEGNLIKVSYSGTVYCSGPCAMLKDSVKND